MLARLTSVEQERLRELGTYPATHLEEEFLQGGRWVVGST